MFGEALSRQMDADIWTELSGLNQSITLSADDVLTADKFEEALANLGENDVPYMDGDCFMVVNPTLYADILNPSGGLAQYFIRAEWNGRQSLRNGRHDEQYNLNRWNKYNCIRSHLSSFSVRYSSSKRCAYSDGIFDRRFRTKNRFRCVIWRKEIRRF